MQQSPEHDPLELTEQLWQEIVGGLLYTHHRANANTSRTLEATAFVYALITHCDACMALSYAGAV